MNTKFEKAILLIDERNSKDPNIELYLWKEYPKELLYSRRMSQKLLEINPNAPEALQIAARAQHICRWEILRNKYPMGKTGYLDWRNKLQKHHSQITSDILKEVGYNDNFIDQVSFLISKKSLKKDKDSQMLEDVVCLVFLEYYLADFGSKHTEEKVIDILQKTWRKMSEQGQKEALTLKLSEKSTSLVKKALV